jgi:hypothetical protein
MAKKHALAVVPVFNAREVIEYKQLQQRGFWVDVEYNIHGWSPKYFPAEFKSEINCRLQDR